MLWHQWGVLHTTACWMTEHRHGRGMLVIPGRGIGRGEMRTRACALSQEDTGARRPNGSGTQVPNAPRNHRRWEEATEKSQQFQCWVPPSQRGPFTAQLAATPAQHALPLPLHCFPDAGLNGADSLPILRHDNASTMHV